MNSDLNSASIGSHCLLFKKPGDIIEARSIIGDRAGLMAKIEKLSALSHIEDIIRLSDAIMVARGDLERIAIRWNRIGALASCLVAFSSTNRRPLRRKMLWAPKYRTMKFLVDRKSWGAHSIHSDLVHSYEEMVELARASVQQEDFARIGDTAVVVAGIPFGQADSTNNIRVVRIR